MRRRERNIDIAVSLGRRLKLSLPVIIASGIVGFGEEYSDIIDYSNYGAIVTKTITLHPREGNPQPRIFELTRGLGMINSIGLENPGLKMFVKEKIKFLESLSTKVIVSIAGDTVGEFIELVKKVSELKFVSGIELNLSCPNIKLKKDKNIFTLVDRKTVHKIVSTARKATKLAIIPKLPPIGMDLIEIAKICKTNGADAIVVANTFPAMEIGIGRKIYPENKKRINVRQTIFGGLSGPAVKPIILRYVYEIHRNVNIPIIASGGIVSVNDVIDYFRVGATVVAIGSVLFSNPAFGEQIVKYLKNNIVT